MAVPGIGALAPDFNLPRDGGGRVSLADYHGKPLVLFFYPKDDTTCCTAESLAFTALAPEFEAAGAAFIGIYAGVFERRWPADHRDLARQLSDGRWELHICAKCGGGNEQPGPASHRSNVAELLRSCG